MVSIIHVHPIKFASALRDEIRWLSRVGLVQPNRTHFANHAFSMSTGNDFSSLLKDFSSGFERNFATLPHRRSARLAISITCDFRRWLSESSSGIPILSLIVTAIFQIVRIRRATRPPYGSLSIR